jgi:hypothetical protein
MGLLPLPVHAVPRIGVLAAELVVELAPDAGLTMSSRVSVPSL